MWFIGSIRSEVTDRQELLLVDLCVEREVEAVTEHLLQCHVLFLLTEDLAHHLVSSHELIILLLMQLDVVLTLEVVESGWQAETRDEVEPLQPDIALSQHKHAQGSKVEDRSGLPQELRVEDFQEL